LRVDIIHKRENQKTMGKPGRPGSQFVKEDICTRKYSGEGTGPRDFNEERKVPIRKGIDHLNQERGQGKCRRKGGKE